MNIQQPTLLDINRTDGAALDNPNTVGAYGSDVRDYLEFAKRREFVVDAAGEGDARFLPASSAGVAAYIDELRLRQLKVSTIRRRVAAMINDRHERGARGSYWRNENVKRAYKRALIEDERGHQRKLAIVDNGVRIVIGAMDSQHLDSATPTQRTALLYVRDRALILGMFFAALTRTEAVTLCIENIIPSPDSDGLRLRVNTSGETTDSVGDRVWVNPFRTRDVTIGRAADPTFCAVTAIERWRRLLATLGITTGYLFRSVLPNGVLRESLTGRQVQEILKERSRRAGESVERISSHSLRSGITATIALRGGPDEVIRERTGLVKLDSMSDVIGRARGLAKSRSVEDYVRL